METHKLGLIWDERFGKVNFGPDHPVSGDRYRQTFTLLQKLELLKEHIEVYEAKPVTDEELLLVHEPAYIKKIKKMSETGIGELSEDTPAFRGMHEYACVGVGGTLTGAKKSIEHMHPFVSIAGGYHHAFPDKGGGFNIYNDVAVTALWLKKQGIFEKIAIIDTDAHHGNGTQAIFYQNSDILTISFHETGKSLYPGVTGEITEIGEKQGKGYCINFPFEPGTASSDVELVWAVRKIVPKAIRAFSPDFLIWQAGVDGHIDDPLSNLRFTTRGFQDIAKIILQVIREFTQGKAIVVAGGGYNLTTASWSYASIIAALAEKRIYIPEEIDQNRYAPPNTVPRPYVFEQLRYLEKHIPLLQ